MKRTLLATLAAAVLSASAFAQSDQLPSAQSDQKPTHAEQAQHWAESALDTQLKGMKAALGLTADQEKDWAAFESAVRDSAKARVLALQKEQSSDLSPMNRNLAKADRIAQGQSNLEKIVEAAKPLYASLDETHKRKFIALGRTLVPERGQFVKAMRRLL
ncbi:MAG: Spy/CpxP family protein refolding chaperone [Roseiarcus sp.]